MTTRQSYAFRTRIQVPFDEAVTRTKAALAAEGFGVLTEIDLRKTLKEKLGAELPPYLILGACNPPLAHRALGATPDVGLLLPCNVVVREDRGGTAVEALDPQAGLEVLGEPALREIAGEARAKLERAIAALSG